MSHAKVMLNLSIIDHEPFYSYIFILFMFHKTNQSKHMANIQEQRNNKTSTLLAQLLAKAGRSCSGELLSPTRELEKRNSGVVALSRLCDTSSPERDGPSLKTGAHHLNDSSRNTYEGFLILSPRRDPLAWARLSDHLNFSCKPTPKYSQYDAQYIFMSF